MFPSLSRVETLQAGVVADLRLFLPEVVVAAGVVLLLLCRLAKPLDRTHLAPVAAAVLIGAFIVLCTTQGVDTPRSGGEASAFAGMLVADPFGRFVRGVVLVAALVTVVVSRVTRIPDADDSGDFYALLLGGTLGMMLMTTANHLLTAFLAVEMASLPGYALAGFHKGRRAGGEAALKYVIYGAAASGVMLYGVSLLAGTFGTGYLPDIAAGVRLRGLDLTVQAGFALVFVGVGFKLAAVPFHVWCPDVFEGATAEVGGFLSVASKAGAVGLAVRLVHVMGADTVGLAVAVVGAVTMTVGNLAAFGQTNLKRLLAYSTVAHAGTMLLAVGAMTAGATAAVVVYLAVYLPMNLGAFAVVCAVRNATGGEDLTAFRGLIRRAPGLAIAMTLFLLSLMGLPPLAGFAGKFQVFASLYSAAQAARPEVAGGLYAVFAVGVLNTAAAAYYYLKVVRVMVLDDPADPTPVAVRPVLLGLVVGLAAAVVAMGVVWDPLATTAAGAVVRP